MLYTYLKLLRAPQWIKNSFVFVPLLFSRHLFDGEYLLPVIQAFLIFCIISSIIYVINDIIDIEADKAHPVKRFRPLPAGEISKQHAGVIAGVLFFLVLYPLYKFNAGFIAAAASYFVLNLLYSTILKHIVLLDIFSIAAGFMIRIVAGALVINVEISSWLILTTMFISLFLAVMKRRSELMLVPPDDPLHGGSTRKVLAFYSLNFTDQMATVAAAGVIICYALYTVSARTLAVFKTENLIYTTPFVVFGIFRYMYLVYMNQKGENTTEIMITDISMIVTVILYVITTTFIIYSAF
jgi:4-hydroxybenzoate polyprenyltransferase